MATKISAQNFITITDLNDARQMTAYLNASLGEVQSWNKDTKTPLEDYTKSPNVITPSVYIAGSADKRTISSITWHITENGTTTDVTAATADTSSFSVDATTGALSVRRNLAGSYMVIVATIKAVDNVGAEVTMEPAITISRNENSTSALVVAIVAARGLAFDSANPTTLSVAAKALRGGEVDNTSIEWKWEKFEGGAWVQLTSGITTANGESTLTMDSDQVDNFLCCRVTASDSEQQDSAACYFTFEDKTDPYSVQLMTKTGNVIKNGTGDTTIYASVYHGTELVEDDDTAPKVFTYTWELYASDGKGRHWDGTTSTQQSGAGLTHVVVKAADVDGRATVICKVSK